MLTGFKIFDVQIVAKASGHWKQLLEASNLTFWINLKSYYHISKFWN